MLLKAVESSVTQQELLPAGAVSHGEEPNLKQEKILRSKELPRGRAESGLGDRWSSASTSTVKLCFISGFKLHLALSTASPERCKDPTADTCKRERPLSSSGGTEIAKVVKTDVTVPPRLHRILALKGWKGNVAEVNKIRLGSCELVLIRWSDIDQFCLEYLMELEALCLFLVTNNSCNKRVLKKPMLSTSFPNLPKCRGSKEEKTPSCLPKILPEFGYAVTNYCQGLERSTGLQALMEYETPSFLSQLIQLMFYARTAQLRQLDEENQGAFKARLRHSLTWTFPEAPVSKVPSRFDSGMAGRGFSLFKVFRGNTRKRPAAAPAQQPEELEQLQPLQDGEDRTPEQDPARDSLPQAGEDRTPEQDPARGRFRRALKVPAMVRDIHQRLVSCVTVDGRLQKFIQRLAEEHTACVVMSLLRCAPSCDRAAALMWRTIGSSRPAAKKVLPALLSVMQDGPLDSTFFSRGDEAIFALAATVVLWWVIAHVPEWHDTVLGHSARLFVALLFQIFSTTEQMPEEVDNFWRACREEHRLPTNPNRFAVQTKKALLCLLSWENGVLALERKRVWDTLLCADTRHYAAGLLAREMRRGLARLCSHIALRLLSLLIGKRPRWDLPALAFLVEVLERLDLSKHGHHALRVMSRQLPSECRDRRRLQLRGLVVLCKEPSLRDGIRGMYQHLVEQLADPDGEMVAMTLTVLTHVLQEKDLKIRSVIAAKLAERLLPHFENDNSHVQLLSIQLFCKVMELVAEVGENAFTGIVSQSLVPLFWHWHDENRRVAELAEYESRAAEQLRWALPCLRSPHMAVRQEAVRCIGLQALMEYETPSFLSQLIQLMFYARTAQLRRLDEENQGLSVPSTSL
ncbi:hypothetical protein DUI87_04293 [Hirundo rustica rustica]|uniref:Maestro heat-like repeat-containing protein family member 6 n=1 Tax=Hirundo rustica rustica TaxID=333673 RepID=A0A3M0L035_HIRRU|nr:hypothetical protein DUI87_04293 [Hirundo rustica rustica]